MNTSPKRFRVWDYARGSELPVENVFWRFQDLVEPTQFADIELHQWVGFQGLEYRQNTPPAVLGGSCDIFEQDLICLEPLEEGFAERFKEDKKILPDAELYTVTWDPGYLQFALAHDSWAGPRPLTSVLRERGMLQPTNNTVHDVSVFTNPNLLLRKKGT